MQITYCDRCRKEIKPIPITKIINGKKHQYDTLLTAIYERFGRIPKRYELCPECWEKVKGFIERGGG